VLGLHGFGLHIPLRDWKKGKAPVALVIDWAGKTAERVGFISVTNWDKLDPSLV
jgi:hypothetical protein